MTTLDPRSAGELRLAPEVAAERAGLIYVTDTVPGISRERGEGGWRYRRPDGTVVTDAGELARIAAIGIPPAWTRVWITPLPDGHLQATGRDGRGRKQYRYHPRWREVQDRTKFHRTGAFGHALPGLRERIDQDLDRPGLPREKVLGAVLRLMDQTLIRIGNEEYARQNQSFGLTTLRHDHVRVEGPTIAFEFRAKSGKEQRVRLSDPRLATVVHACHELPGQELFSYVDDAGQVVDVGSADVNAYLRAVTHAVFTAKDFRTWGGTRVAAESLVDLGPPRSPADARRKILAAIDAAAARLNNTRAVCRASYVNPRVPDAYVEGSLTAAFDRAGDRQGLSHSESAMLLVIG
ncbi:DNA topoisomerase IB [Geodermatophilus ruber]|uniref:DNA topoisomerase n=1 Tax=Geodermatophilus ruber TaxID=504800 RepID=A0A1I4AER0_9ACTN|nr:DNA topoisomerase IB [Geodermatophilus ruber]SFK54925.1 DNA topoisomerase-1 [Geodermatophilus ruber]